MAAPLSRSVAAITKDNLGLFKQALESHEGALNDSLADCLGRFKLWAGNIGALHTGKSSVENRLGSSRLLQDLTSLLEELKESLQYLVDPVTDLEEGDADATPNEIYGELLETTSMTITSLLKTSALIRNNPQRDPWKRVLAMPPWYAAPMVDNAIQRWPKLNAQPWLASRLGLANSRRRQYFQYREQHVEKLARPLQDSAPPASETAPTTFFGHTQLLRSESNQDVDDALSDTTLDTAFGEDLGARMIIPSPPAQYETRDVECSLCHEIVSVPTRRAWKKHVYRDLRPYVCLFKECDFKVFGRRREWQFHEMSEHRTLFHCPLCSQKSLGKCGLRQHLRATHMKEISDLELESMVSGSRSSPPLLTTLMCSFCDQWHADRARLMQGLQPDSTQIGNGSAVVSEKQFIKHLGQHMEQLSLFALPKGLEDDHTASDASNASSESLSEVQEETQPSLLTRKINFAEEPTPVSDKNGVAAESTSDVSSDPEKGSTQPRSEYSNDVVNDSDQDADPRSSSTSSIVSTQPVGHLSCPNCHSGKYHFRFRSDKSVFSCGSCEAYFDSDGKGVHVVGNDSNDGPGHRRAYPATFQCNLCPKRFTRAFNFRAHLRTHTDERPFVCTVCGEAFFRQTDVKRHERSLHSGEKKDFDWYSFEDESFEEQGQHRNLGSQACTIPNVPKSILRTPTAKFPEESDPIREGVAPRKDTEAEIGTEIPHDARWTKIARSVVDPTVLEENGERFELRDQDVIVLRVLTKEQIQKYVAKTHEMRLGREDAVEQVHDQEDVADEEREKDQHEYRFDYAKEVRRETQEVRRGTQVSRPVATKRGRTRMPKRLVHMKAIIDLDYPFEEEDDFFVVQYALSKKEIDETIGISEKYRESDTRTYQYEREKEKIRAAEVFPLNNKQTAEKESDEPDQESVENQVSPAGKFVEDNQQLDSLQDAKQKRQVSSENDVAGFMKSFRVRVDDPCYKVLPMAMKKYQIEDDPSQYSLYIVHGDEERCLGRDEKPLILFKLLANDGKKPMFMLRKHATPSDGFSSRRGVSDDHATSPPPPAAPSNAASTTAATDNYSDYDDPMDSAGSRPYWEDGGAQVSSSDGGGMATAATTLQKFSSLANRSSLTEEYKPKYASKPAVVHSPKGTTGDPPKHASGRHWR